MNTISSQFSGIIRGLLSRPTGGIVGLVDDLLLESLEHGLQLEWQADRCRFRSPGSNWEELTDVPLSKSAFRAILARIAALCNERIPNSVSPYGGEGELSVGTNPVGVLRVVFVNTPAAQTLELTAPTGRPAPGKADDLAERGVVDDARSAPNQTKIEPTLLALLTPSHLAGSVDLPPNSCVQRWLAECVNLCQPARLRVLDGSEDERRDLLQQAVAEGVLMPLNPDKLPGCYLHRSNPNDVARTEQNTFICTPGDNLAGPTNNWWDPKQAYARLRELFTGSLRGKTMYVIPFVMGPLGSPLARVGVQLTDSIYVALSMGIMTRMGRVAWEQLGDSDDFTRCLHAVADCNPERRYICHFLLDNTIWSYGSGYGGNALLGKKCLALRLASFLGYQSHWLAEHMLLMGVTTPAGEKVYIAGAFPSACGKTNFAMLIPPEKYQKAGWKISTLGDDIAWMYVNDHDGRVWAINPEAGYFGVLPGTNWRTNPNAMRIISHDTIYTNVGLLPDGDVWWEGKTDEPPRECIDWLGQPWTPDCGRKAAHPNSRFTAPMSNNPVLDDKANDPAGVPVSGILFGGRRSKEVPLVVQAFNWIHGVYMGATLSSETTAAATGQVGVVRRDPMAMLPFCGYNLNYYLKHWMRMRKHMRDCPRIFQVNWFRKDDAGRFIWPGYSENMRILKWIVERCQGQAYAAETLLGWMPRPRDIDLEGLDLTEEQFAAVQEVDLESLKRELLTQEELFMKLAGDLPKELTFQRELLISRL